MFDLLIKNGTVVNGEGKPFPADVGIADGRIAAVGNLAGAAGRIIDAAGCCVTPGFIDMHGLGDFAYTHKKPFLAKVTQGVTSEVTGNCGISGAPYNKTNLDFIREYGPVIGRKGAVPHWYTWRNYLKVLGHSPLPVNLIPLVGHGNLHTMAGGDQKRMRRLLITAMDSGCRGFSTGLIYSPGIFTSPSEIGLLAEAAAEFGGIYTSHIRGEGAAVEAAVRECVAVAKAGGISAEISHIKTAGPSNWSKTEGIIRFLADKREQGVNINFDQYPYTASSTTAVILLPPWMREGGLAAVLQRLNDPAQRRRAAADLKTGLPGWENYAQSVGWRKIIVNQVRSRENRWMEGLDFETVGRRLSRDPADVLFDTLLAEKGAVNMIAHTMSEDSVRLFLRRDFGFIGSDGLPVRRPHPRLWGSFARVLRKYVREEKVLTLTEAVHKMSAGPAAKLGLRDRGTIKKGMVADIAVFDQERVRDNADYQNPVQPAGGFKAVIVSGQVVISNDRFTGLTPGRLLSES